MRLRPPAPRDAPAIVAVLAARDVADRDEIDTSLGEVLDEWHASDFDLATDARVVELDGRIAAYAVVRRRGTLGASGFERRGSAPGCWRGSSAASSSMAAMPTAIGSRVATGVRTRC
jgi:hypothetical protein